MKKTTGKVLSFVLSLALVLTSFPAMLASASTHHTVSGTLSDTDKDKIYLVNGGKDTDTVHQQTYPDLQSYIFGDTKDCTLESDDHQNKEDAKIAAISHKSGDRLVKWYEGDDEDKDSIDDDTNKVDIQLRSPTVKGHEVLSIEYKASYTDDDDNDVTIKGRKDFDVYVYDKGETVIGKADALTGGDAQDISDGKKSAELDDDFAEKTVSHETAIGHDGNSTDPDNKKADHMNLTVFEATNEPDSPLVNWVALKTTPDKTSAGSFDQEANKTGAHVYYTLKSSNGNIDLKKAGCDASGADLDTSDGTPTTTKPGLTFATGTVTIAPPVTTTYTYKYKIGTGTETEVTGTTFNIPATTSDGAIITVTAYDGASVVGKATGTYKAAVTTPAAAPATLDTSDGTPTATKPGLTFDATSGDVTVAPLTTTTYTYKYKIGDGNENDVTGTTFAIPTTTPDGTTITVTAYDGANVVGTATGKYKAAVDANPDLGYVTATVKKASSGGITFTAELTDWGKDNTTPDSTNVELSTTKDVKVKSAIAKKIKVDNVNFKNLLKHSGSTYITSNSSLDNDSAKAKDSSVKVNGLEIKFDGDTMSGVDVKVAEKASVAKISGKLKSLNISDGSNVNSIELDKCDPTITVSDAKVGDIDFDDVTADGQKNTLDVDSTKASVGNVTDATDITVKSGKTGNLSADNEITINADDDDSETTVGDIKAATITLDSEDSKLSVGNVKADEGDNDADTEITLKGNNLTVKAIDFDNYDTSLKFDDFQGKIAAPKNASQDGANIQTTNGDDRVEITGDCDVDGVTVEDDSQITFDGKLNVSSVDGDGTLAIGAGKMYIDSDVSGTILKLTDATLTKGMTAFTSLNDTVDEDDFDCYGFTLAKSEGNKTDTFKIDSVVFKGLSVNKTSSEIAKDHSETFTAYSYPGGTTMPAGYTVKWALDDADDTIFQLTTNANGTATVKAIGYDTDFASANKCTLTATLVDPDGDEVDEDDYATGKCDLTALAVPKVTHTSDTTKNFSLAQGASYQFKITSSDGSEPTFGVGSGSLAVSKVGKSGNAYFYKVTAVGKVGDQVGVYLDKTRLLVVTISASSVKLDTGAKLSVAKGKTYQFKATSTAAVKATTGNGAVFQIVKVTKAGNNTFVTVKAVGSKGQSTGIYFNGVRRTIATVA